MLPVFNVWFIQKNQSRKKSSSAHCFNNIEQYKILAFACIFLGYAISFETFLVFIAWLEYENTRISLVLSS